jgi:PTS system nitrogen regulatory IIA component
MIEERLMSIKEVAEYLQVDMSTLYLWSQRGQIPAMKVGKMWRFRRSEIDAWLDQSRNQSTKDKATSRRTG